MVKRVTQLLRLRQESEALVAALLALVGPPAMSEHANHDLSEIMKLTGKMEL